MRELVAACLQLRVVPGNVDANLANAREGIEELASGKCRLVVLPEMWACGFPYSRLQDVASRTPEVVEEMRGWARRHGMVLVGSLPESVDGRVYNTSYVIDANGEIAGSYRKVHLFSLHHEDLHFGRGETSLVCSTEAGELGVMICYDLRFPELGRKLALDGARIMCVSSHWPDIRIDHWSLLLRARAVENQLFVIGCNGCGTEKKMRYGGASAIISPMGKALIEAGTGPESIAAALDMEEVDRFRKLITCFPDRVPAVYE
ncbi:MAG TPA: carbon-nitrogen family hydrolase [Syntrophobacter fumaroxidans]|nr:carbon-nitrogen family hydrolase [Syntrophobacter fumaroxidans]